MIEKINVGFILKPQGVKGELKVEPLTDDVNRFKALKKVFIDQKPYKVAHARISSGVAFLCLEGITDRNTAELFRNKYIVIDREDAVELKENSYFVADLVGSLCFFEDGKEFGEVIEIIPNRTDIFTVKTTNGKTARFPFLLDVVVNVNVESGKITLNEKRLMEVCLYED